MLPPLGATPPQYSKISDISAKNASQKKRRKKRQNIYSVGLHPREVGIVGGQGEGTNVEATKTSGKRGQCVINISSLQLALLLKK